MLRAYVICKLQSTPSSSPTTPLRHPCCRITPPSQCEDSTGCQGEHSNSGYSAPVCMETSNVEDYHVVQVWGMNAFRHVQKLHRCKSVVVPFHFFPSDPLLIHSFHCVITVTDLSNTASCLDQMLPFQWFCPVSIIKLRQLLLCIHRIATQGGEYTQPIPRHVNFCHQFPNLKTCYMLRIKGVRQGGCT